MKGLDAYPEFKAVNPRQRVPTLVDGDVMLTESNCIMRYLVDRGIIDLCYYPDDITKRTMIDSCLDYF